MEISYSTRLKLLYGLCKAETQPDLSLDIESYDVLEAATFISCYLCFKAIQVSERSPTDELVEDFDLLGVYQAFAMLIYTYIVLPLANESIEPAFDYASVTIVKSLFAQLSEDQLVEIIESGDHKLRFVGNSELETWANYRQDVEKVLLAFIVAGTDENNPFEKEEMFPILGSLLSILCESFSSN